MHISDEGYAAIFDNDKVIIYDDDCDVQHKVIVPKKRAGFSSLTMHKGVYALGYTKSTGESQLVVFLKSGLVKIHITGPYREQIVRLTKAPTYLGLPTTIGDKINQYSVTAVADSEVCFIDVNVFKKLLDDNHDFSYQIILDLCRNELESFRRCANRTQRQSRGNIAAFLLELSNDIAESNLFVLPLSQNEIGNLVDTTRENVSRILAEFDKDQIISLKGKNVEILNKNSLELISKNG